MFHFESTNIDFGNTEIENIFINDFMPMASGIDVKVYLLGFRYAQDVKEGKVLDHDSIARTLKIYKSEVMRAWENWEKLGVVKIDESEGQEPVITFCNLKQLYVENMKAVEEKKTTSDGVDDKIAMLVAANANEEINNLFNDVDFMMRRPTMYGEKQKVLDWIKNYNMTPEVIREAFLTAERQKGRYRFNYVDGIIRNWYDKGMTNPKALEEGLKDEDIHVYRLRRVLNQIGLSNRNFSMNEIDLVDSWFTDLRYNWDMVEEACKRIVYAEKPSLGYIDSILKSWRKKDINEKEEIESKDVKPKVKKPTKKTGFHNFEGRSDHKDLEEALKKKRNQQFKQKGE